MLDSRLQEFIKRMPKVELHCHLEGSIRPETAMELMERNQSPSKPASSEKVRELYRFKNLTEFVNGMKTVSNNIQQLEDLARVTHELLESLYEQNVRYIEFDCALQKYVDLGFDLADVVDTVYQQVNKTPFKNNLKAGMVVNLLRSKGADAALDMVNKIDKLGHPLIVGIGLSGDEGKYPQKLFQKAFLRASELGIHRTVHAGEALGPDSVWDAINYLHAERIDHGTLSVYDENLVAFIIQQKIALTQCLTSNIKLNVVENFQKHPFPGFFKKGVLVTLNTDDPQVFETSLNREYELAIQEFGFSIDDLEKIMLNGVQASFLDEQSKIRMYDALHCEIQEVKEIFDL